MNGDMLGSFAVLLTEYRTRAKRSRNSLALEAAIDPSYLTRIEHGDREPPRRDIIDALARALRLTAAEHDRLYIAAHYAPVCLEALGAWPNVLDELTHALADLPSGEAEELALVVRRLVRSYGRGGTDGARTD